MQIDDYSKYYIQGSDHYLIPKDEFIELFNEMQNWKNEFQQLEEKLNVYENPDDLTLMFMYCEEKSKDKIKELKNTIAKVIDNLEKSIETINAKLADKEIRCVNGIVINPPNDYRIVRLKGIRSKCKELLCLLKGDEE